MKIAILGDCHLGCRNDNVNFHDYISNFYTNCFFPYIISQKIDTIIQLGDCFDRRKYVNFNSLYRSKEYFFDVLKDLKINTHIILGNHDCFYKNTNSLNSPELLLGEYDNITIYSGPKEVQFDCLNIAMLPWICQDNQEEIMKFLENTSSEVVCSHLELAGFEMYRGTVNDHGMDAKTFEKFDLVMSGHFHHRSSRGNINYLGTSYEITWSDWNDQKGFHIFDTDTRELQFIENPYKMFHKIHYDDSIGTMDTILDIDVDQFKNTYVKVIIHEKNNPYWFDCFIDKIEKASVADLQVVEDNLNLDLEDDSDLVSETEDTLTILRKSVDQFRGNVNKKKLDSFLVNLYQEALNVE